MEAWLEILVEDIRRLVLGSSMPRKLFFILFYFFKIFLFIFEGGETQTKRQTQRETDAENLKWALC